MTPFRGMTLKQLAIYLGVSRSTVRRMVKRGEGPPAVPIGRRPYWLATDVDRWLSERKDER